MGTSSSHSGNKDKKGLLPSDFGEQQSKPEVSWKTTKIGFSKYINGHGGSVGKTVKNYVKASGGTEQLFRSSKSGVRGAVNIGRLYLYVNAIGKYLLVKLQELPDNIQQQGYVKEIIRNAFISDNMSIDKYITIIEKECCVCKSIINYVRKEKMIKYLMKIL